MSLSTPTTQQLRDNIVAQISAQISQTIPLLPKAFIPVLASVLAGAFILLYKYAGFSLLQEFVAYASWDETVVNGKTIRPLVEWGRLVGVGDPLDATPAELSVQVVVTNPTGFLAAGSQLVFAASGVIYETESAVSLTGWPGNLATVTIVAVADADGNGGVGTIGNLQPGDIVQFANPIPNIARNATVLSQVTTGADAETLDAYRARVVRRFQNKPQGGAYADYQEWADGVAGIANAYPYTGNPGEVNVYVEAVATDDSPDGIPTDAQLDDVAAAIELDVNGLASNRPANAAVNVLPITRKAYNLQVLGLASTDLPGAQSALEQAVDQYLRGREPFIVGLSVLPRLDRITQSAISGVADEAVSAVGGTMTSLTLLDGATPVIAYTLGQGEKSKFGSAVYF